MRENMGIGPRINVERTIEGNKRLLGDPTDPLLINPWISQPMDRETDQIFAVWGEDWMKHTYEVEQKSAHSKRGFD